MIWNLELQISYPENQNSCSNCNILSTIKLLIFFRCGHQTSCSLRSCAWIVQIPWAACYRNIFWPCCVYVTGNQNYALIPENYRRTRDWKENGKSLSFSFLLSSFFVFLYLSILSTQYSEYTVCVTKSLSNMHSMRVTNHWCL